MAKPSPAYGKLKLVAEVTKEVFCIEPLPLSSSVSPPLLGNSGNSFPLSHLLCLEQDRPSSVSFATHNCEMENEEAVSRKTTGEAEETRTPASPSPRKQISVGFHLPIAITWPYCYLPV